MLTRTKVSSAVAMAAAAFCFSALAAPVTFFGEDLNGPPRNDPNALAAWPNADAARNAFLANLTGVGTENFEGHAVTTPPITLTFPGAGTATLTGGAGIASGNDGAGPSVRGNDGVMIALAIRLQKLSDS